MEFGMTLDSRVKQDHKMALYCRNISRRMEGGVHF